MDADRPFRTRLIQDAREQVQRLGVPADAILIGGDVAFKGHPQEYLVAFDWIKELAASTRCPIERVFVIPGNHDVDRGHLRNDPVATDAQTQLFEAQAPAKERKLRTIINDEAAGPALLSAHRAYNDFAKRFNCQIYSPERLYWKQDIALGEDCTLRISGLTSTLLSGRGGNAEERGDLYLSPLQTVLDPVDDVVHLAMCHHPPDWLSDGDDANDAICGRAMIQVFGHKHRQRITREHSFVRFSAGAVNPDRQEPGWNPGYNLIEVAVAGAGLDRRIEVRGHLRQWQTNPDLYRPMRAPNESDVFEHSMSFPRRSERVPPVLAAENGVEALAPDTKVLDPEAAMGDEGTRNLVFRFWNLTVSQRRAVAVALDLLDQSETSLPEPERYGRVLRRAGERGLLSRLAEEIARRELSH